MRQRHAAKIDANQEGIVSALRKAGPFVQIIGQPFDLLVGWKGLWHVLEVKDGAKPPSAQVLTTAQLDTLAKLRNMAPGPCRPQPHRGPGGRRDSGVLMSMIEALLWAVAGFVLAYVLDAIREAQEAQRRMLAIWGEK